MSLIAAVVQRFLALLIGSFYCAIVILQTAIDCLRRGPKTVLGRRQREKPPPCLEDPSLGTHGYVHLEHIRMHYVSNGSEDKPLMLLVHGFPEFWYSWRHQLREFKDDYRVVAMDLRGYNETDQPSGIGNYSTSCLTNDLKQLITALGYSSCVLVGHDWGGALAWVFAEKYPDLVSKLIILNCPNGRAFQKHLRKSLTQFKMSWYMFFFQIPWVPEFKLASSDYETLEQMFTSKEFGVQTDRMTSEDVEAYKYAFSRSGFTGPINFYRAAFSLKGMVQATDMRRKSKEQGITMPTLVIWGDRDAALDKPLAELSCEICKNKFTIKYVEGASHWVQMDEPDLVNQYMREFLEE